jgi:3-phenylpropionate/trans-cinnamate dioxygenase ferredoxin reductase subunit
VAVVIIGAGHGGVQAAASLRDANYDGAVLLVDEQPDLPYHRPALSKAFLKSDDPEPPPLRNLAFFSERNITLELGTRIAGIDRAEHRVRLADGRTLGFDKLVLATGARSRPAPFSGADLAGVFGLRLLHDSRSLRTRLAGVERVVVVGAGFIGLEFAAIAAEAGKAVTVIDIADRVMSRSVSPIMSEAFARFHESLGTRFLFEQSVAEIVGRGGHVEAVRLADGTDLPADLVLVGVGVVANDALAADAGIAVRDGVLVDAFMRSSDPDIYAIGDVARFDCAHGGAGRRYESVPNAVDQARVVAADITGTAAAYSAVPWFWSDQGKAKLQIVGSPPRVDEYVVRGDPGSFSFSVFGFVDGKVAVVESLNRAGDHAAMRRQLPDCALTPAMVADETVSLRPVAKGQSVG